MDSKIQADMSALRYPLDSLRTHGPLGTLRRTIIALPHQLKIPQKKSKVFSAIDNYLCKTQKLLDSQYDRRYGIDTAGVIPLEELTINSHTAKEGIWYEPMSVKIFRQIISHLNINFKDYTFVDFGSGKGRVLILASEYGFRRIIGVEFAKELYEISRQNIINYREHVNIKPDISTNLQDAIQFTIPPDKSVLFFYSPFRGDVMECVISNICDSHRENPREIIIIFYGQNSNTLNLFSSNGFRMDEIDISADWRHFTRYRAFIISVAD